MKIRPLKEVRRDHNRFLVYTPIGNMWVTAHLLDKNDEYYDRGFLRKDYTGLCEFKFWDDGPAIPFPEPKFDVVKE